MGLIYLPTWMADFYGIHVGKYTIVPWILWALNMTTFCRGSFVEKLPEPRRWNWSTPFTSSDSCTEQGIATWTIVEPFARHSLVLWFMRSLLDMGGVFEKKLVAMKSIGSRLNTKHAQVSLHAIFNSVLWGSVILRHTHRMCLTILTRPGKDNSESHRVSYWFGGTFHLTAFFIVPQMQGLVICICICKCIYIWISFMRIYVYIIYIYYRSMDQHKYMHTCRCKHCEHGIVLDHFLTHRSRLRKWVSSATWMRFYTFLRLGKLHKRYEIALGESS